MLSAHWDKAKKAKQSQKFLTCYLAHIYDPIKRNGNDKYTRVSGFRFFLYSLIFSSADFLSFIRLREKLCNGMNWILHKARIKIENLHVKYGFYIKLWSNTPKNWTESNLIHSKFMEMLFMRQFSNVIQLICRQHLQTNTYTHCKDWNVL